VRQPVRDVAPPQEVRFCQAPDGVRIAYARHGSGPPLVIASCWLSHLQYDWQSPVWRHFVSDFGEMATIVRYDERGHGMSDWDVDDFGLEARVADLEAVVDHAGLDQFALMAMSQGGPVAIAYAARHPERVTRLAFYNSYAAAYRDPTPEDLELRAAFDQLLKVGWARPDSVFRRVFTSLMIPGATEEQMRWLDELQRVSVSAENAIAARRQRSQANMVDLLPQLDTPTLVIHSRHDQMIKFEEGRFLASMIPRARLLALDSSNHILLEDEPAWPVFLAEVGAFLQPDRQPQERPVGADVVALLSARELDVLKLAADGEDNEAIAEILTLSVRTVERHFHNIYTKLDLHGKSARAAAVSRLLTRS
jgi:pimeloyl-ACP methyl ester carboxylesterase/DNA-binding CsgD family transcriptional regulator